MFEGLISIKSVTYQLLLVGGFSITPLKMDKMRFGIGFQVLDIEPKSYLLFPLKKVGA